MRRQALGGTAHACWARAAGEREWVWRAGRVGERARGRGRSVGGQAAEREAGAGVGARGAGRERAERAGRAGWACLCARAGRACARRLGVLAGQLG